MLNSYTESLMNQGYSEDEATAIYMRNTYPQPAPVQFQPRTVTLPPAPQIPPIVQPQPSNHFVEYVAPPSPTDRLTPNVSGWFSRGYTSSPPGSYRPAPVQTAPVRRAPVRRAAPTYPLAPRNRWNMPDSGPHNAYVVPAPAPVAAPVAAPAEDRDDFGVLVDWVDDLDNGRINIGDYGVDLTNPDHVPASAPVDITPEMYGKLAGRYFNQGAALLAPVLGRFATAALGGGRLVSQNPPPQPPVKVVDGEVINANPPAVISQPIQPYYGVGQPGYYGWGYSVPRGLPTNQPAGFLEMQTGQPVLGYTPPVAPSVGAYQYPVSVPRPVYQPAPPPVRAINNGASSSRQLNLPGVQTKPAAPKRGRGRPRKNPK